MSTESELDWDKACRRAQAALDALDEYDRTRNEMRLLRDLNRVVEEGVPLRSDEEEDAFEARKDAEWDRSEVLKEMRNGD